MKSNTARSSTKDGLDPLSYRGVIVIRWQHLASRRRWRQLLGLLLGVRVSKYSVADLFYVPDSCCVIVALSMSDGLFVGRRLY